LSVYLHFYFVSLQEVVYEKSIGTKMNDLDLCLEVYQGHVNHCVTFDIEYLGNQRPRPGSKGPPIRNSLRGIKWSRDRWRHVTVKGQTVTRIGIRLERNISKTANY